MRVLLGVLVAICAGCAPVQYRIAVPFDLALHKAAMAEGKTKAEGQGFLRTNGGDVKVAAGSKVILYPDTPYLRECVAISKQVSVEAALWGYRSECGNLMQVVRETVADGEGRFTFANVKPGSYYVETTVTWNTGYTYADQGGTFGVYFAVPEGRKKVSVVVTL